MDPRGLPATAGLGQLASDSACLPEFVRHNALPNHSPPIGKLHSKWFPAIATKPAGAPPRWRCPTAANRRLSGGITPEAHRSTGPVEPRHQHGSTWIEQAHPKPPEAGCLRAPRGNRVPDPATPTTGPPNHNRLRAPITRLSRCRIRWEDNWWNILPKIMGPIPSAAPGQTWAGSNQQGNGSHMSNSRVARVSRKTVA